MIPLYPAEMGVLPKSDPEMGFEIYEEFLSGNWVGNKNQDTAFCAFAADNALGWDHFDSKRSSKVFLIAPELSHAVISVSQKHGRSFFFWEKISRGGFRGRVQGVHPPPPPPEIKPSFLYLLSKLVYLTGK